MNSRSLDKNSREYKELSKKELLDTCKREERALEDALKREETLKTIINNSPVTVFLWKNEEKWPVEYVSENVDRFGYTAEDFISGGLLYGDIIHPEDLGKIEEQLDRQVRAGGAPDFNMEYRVLTKAGKVRWVSERTFIQRDASGKVTNFQGVVLDITALKESEEALKKSIEREKALMTVVNNSPTVVFLWKNEKNWPAEYVSENVVQLGYTADNFINEGLLYGEIIHPDDLKKVEEELDRRIQEGAVDFNMEYRVLTKAGNVRWVSERTFIQRDAAGEITHYQGIVLDITARKESEKALKKALEDVKVLKTVIDNSPAVVFLWKNEKNWPAVFVSENIEQFGYTSQDFLSKAVLYGNIIHPDDLERVVRELSRCIEAGYNDFMIEYRIFTKDGKLRWVDERTFIKRDPEGRATQLQGIVVDVSARKEAEELLEIERALSTSLSSTWSLQIMLNEVLNACLRVEGIDSGGVYLVDELLDQINLVAHRGLSLGFVEKVSIFEAESPEARQIMREKPTYKLSFFSEKLLEQALEEEGLKGVAVIPLKYKEEVIGSLNLASHSTEEVPPNIRTFLETIALQVVNYIAPIRIEADLT